MPDFLQSQFFVFHVFNLVHVSEGSLPQRIILRTSIVDLELLLISRFIATHDFEIHFSHELDDLTDDEDGTCLDL